MREVTYCSFASNGGCLGVCILNGFLDPVQASKEARRLKINPGGELLAVPCKETDEDLPPYAFETMWVNRNRLIPVEEATVLFDAKSIRELDDELGSE